MNIKDVTRVYQDKTGELEGCSVFEFIEMLVTMNKSLNQMMEDFVFTQNQLKMLKTHQSNTLEELNEQGKILQNNSERFSKLDEKLELADIKQV